MDKEATITKEVFGTMPDGQTVDLYTLKNANGVETSLTNYGAIVVTLKVPDRQGNPADIVLGYDTLEEYLKGSPYFGAIVGRYANRIASGRFTLGGKEYTLAMNEGGKNHLHGGVKGFDKVVWEAEEVRTDEGVGVALSYLSKDGEEGYPGNLSVEVTYLLTHDNALKVSYCATTDRTTIINLSHHGYFNLAGHDGGDILGHEISIHADRFIPVNENLIPIGELWNVEGTPLDFRTPHSIGERIQDDDQQLRYGGGYDHCWVLNGRSGALAHAATVYEPNSGRVMEVHTAEPGLQFYSGNFLDGSNVGKGGHAYQHRTAIVLETEHFPDSPNQPDFPSVILEPGETYSHEAVFRFSTR